MKESLISVKHWWSLHVSWPWIKRILTIAFFSAVAYLIYDRGSAIEWSKVFETLRDTSSRTLFTAFVLVFFSYLAYGTYDLFGRHLLGLKIPAYKASFAAIISYCTNLNFGSLIGSIAFRYRLYSRLGVSSTNITKLVGISVATNWLGYLLLAGGLFVSGSMVPPGNWVIGKIALQMVGAVLLLLVMIYLSLCAFSPKRELTVRSHTLTLPSTKIAFLQLAASCAHWILMASVVYQFFSDDLEFTTVFAVLLTSAVAGAVSHVPAGLGVLEAVFIALLAGQVERYKIIAAFLAYRSVYYLAPAVIVIPLYLWFERHSAKANAK